MPSPLEITAAAVNKYPEMTWLTGRVEATPALKQTADSRQQTADSRQQTADSRQQSLTVGQRLFPATPRAELAEFDRTAVGLLALRWVLDGDYDSFIACQPESARLSRANFNSLRNYTLDFVGGSGVEPNERGALNQEAVDALETFIVINDLGKIDRVIEDIAARTGIRDVDHDRVLAAGLTAHPEISPSFMRLAPQYRNMIVRGLQTEFNPAQFVQGENVPASLQKLQGLDADAQRLYQLHSLYDVAGAAGQAVQNGSVVMTDPTYHNFRLAFDALDQLDRHSVETVYDGYLASRGREMGLDISIPRHRAVARIGCMLRVSEPNQARRIADVYGRLTPNIQAILDKDLNTNGTSDGLAPLVYYAPALLGNLQKKLNGAGGGAQFDQAMEIGLTSLARIFQEARIANKAKEGNGVFTVMASDVAQAAARDPEQLLHKEFFLTQIGNDAAIQLNDAPRVHNESFSPLADLSQLPGNRLAVIGIGGGSDCVQATAVAKLLEQAGKDSACVISIRTGKTQSQGATGRTGETRTVTNHGGEVHDDVYAITPETTGSGRFLENIAAGEKDTYLVIENDPAKLTTQLNAVLQHVGDVDTVVAVDTGGDALHPTGGKEEASRATPDQDLRVLRALHGIPGNVNKVTCEIAVGVDSPANAETVLESANARYYQPTPDDARELLASYSRWHMDGSDNKRFGKTASAWQAALKGQNGVQDIGVPTDVVLDPKNPWRPFVPVQPAMQGLFFMQLDDHLRSIGAIPPQTRPSHSGQHTGFGPDFPGQTGGGRPGGVALRR